MTKPDIGATAQVSTWILKNGLRVAVMPDPRARIFSIDLRYDAGTSDDPAQRPGLALLTGEAVVGAAFAQPAPDVELTTQLAVDLDRVELTTTTLDLDGALELTAHRLAATCADLPLGEARKHAASQITGTSRSFVQAVWGDRHPYAKDLVGEPLADPDVCAFFTAHFGARAATLVITGPVGTDLQAKLEAKIGAIAAHGDAGHDRVAIPSITPTKDRVRAVVWGLGRPTAAIVIPVPALGDQDDLVPELAMRRLQNWAAERNTALHTAFVGGRRGRALVVALEASSEADLGGAHEKLKDMFQAAWVNCGASSSECSDTDESQSDATADDILTEAQIPDDPFTRGAAIADLVASGRRVELLRRTRGFAAAKSQRVWIRDHLASGSARQLDLIPAVPGQGASIEQLSTPGEIVDRLLAGTYTTETVALTAAPLARPLERYTLSNGLEVVLASDPIATTFDARIVITAGMRDEPVSGVAVRAAGLRVIDDRVGPDTDAQKRLAWYGELAGVKSDTEVTNRTTHFRTTGFAALGDWHIFGLAWRMIRGHYTASGDALEPFARHYAPKEATLIVSGGFNPAALKPVIERWFTPWQNPKEPPPKGLGERPRRVVSIDAKESESFDLELGFAAKRDVKAGTGRILAAALQQRLTLSLRGSATIDVAFDSRDGRLLATAQIDPAASAQIVKAIAAEIDAMRSNGLPAPEVESARRLALAMTLVGEVGATGRARQLEDAISRTHPATDDTPVSELIAATADDVTDAAHRLLDPDTRSVTLRSANKKDREQALRSLGMDPAKVEWRGR